MPLQILTLKLDGITAGDYLTWCRDPEPPALDFALRSISVDADPLGDTITVIIDWNESPPPPPAAASAAGLPLPIGAQIDAMPIDRSQLGPLAIGTGLRLRRAAAAVGAGNRRRVAPSPQDGVEGQRRTAA